MDERPEAPKRVSDSCLSVLDGDFRSLGCSRHVWAPTNWIRNGYPRVPFAMTKRALPSTRRPEASIGSFSARSTSWRPTEPRAWRSARRRKGSTSSLVTSLIAEASPAPTNANSRSSRKACWTVVASSPSCPSHARPYTGWRAQMSRDRLRALRRTRRAAGHGRPVGAGSPPSWGGTGWARLKRTALFRGL